MMGLKGRPKKKREETEQSSEETNPDTEIPAKFKEQYSEENIEEDNEMSNEEFLEAAPTKNVAPRTMLRSKVWEIKETPTEVVYKLVNNQTGEELSDWNEVEDFLNSLYK